MLNLILLFVQIVTTLVRLAGPGGVRSVVAESVLLRHQLLVLNRLDAERQTLAHWIDLSPDGVRSSSRLDDSFAAQLL